MSSDAEYSPDNEEEVDRVMNAEGKRQENETSSCEDDNVYIKSTEKFDRIRDKIISKELNAEKQKVMNDIYRESSQMARKISYVIVLAENEIRTKVNSDEQLKKIEELKEKRIQSLFQEYGYPMMTPETINFFVNCTFIHRQYMLAILLERNIDEMANKRLKIWVETAFGGSNKRKTSNKKKKTLKSKKRKNSLTRVFIKN